MKRRDFFRHGSLGTLGLGLASGITPFPQVNALDGTGASSRPTRTAKNIIFMVSDGMSIGTLQLADLLCQLQTERHSHWLQLYLSQQAQRGLMDTASANAYVTDSAAASSAWGGGVRVPNGRLNVTADGESKTPILQKFKAVGKRVGCVTSVPITHATPAGFCVASKSRGDQAEIAQQYLGLKFDVMLGGGREFFAPDQRDDNVDLWAEYRQEGYHVCRNKQAMAAITDDDRPVMGAFSESGIPYAIDHQHDDKLLQVVPTLAEMARFAIDRLNQGEQGFVMQIEGGKVDWAAHANDTPAILHDQLAFDEAIKVALDFALRDQQTLLIVTTDHGNANPGLIGTKDSVRKFKRCLDFRGSHESILLGIDPQISNPDLRHRIEQTLGFAITVGDAEQIQAALHNVTEDQRYNPYRLPFSLFAKVMSQYTGIGWAGTDHSGDYVELTMVGPGSEMLRPFVQNTELHDFMLTAAGITQSVG